MAMPTAEEITNLFLYGQTTLPSDRLDASLIRSPSTSVRTYVNIDEYMESGPGRFASIASFEVVERFLNASRYADSYALAPGRYTKAQLFSSFGMDGDIRRRIVTLQQSLYTDGRDDLIERAYIWNTTGFKLDDRAVFVIEPDGRRYVENLAIVPYSSQTSTVPADSENFDFSGGGLSAVANAYLQPKVDPSNIGRQVVIEFSGVRTVPTSQFDLGDLIEAESRRITPSPIDALADFTTGTASFLDRLFQSGSTRSLTPNNKPIVYGTDAGDSLYEGVDISMLLDHPQLSSYVPNGIAYVMGKGNDTVFAVGFNDELYGGRGNDSLNGGDGNDLIRGDEDDDALFGGEDNDTLLGGEGNDELRGGFGRDTLDGGANDDVLNGGFDNDFIKGGSGTDKYEFSPAFGSDIVQDSDGQGSVVIAGATLSGGKRRKGEAVYKNTVDGSSYVLVGRTLYIVKQGVSGNVTVRDWANGDLGIRLVEDIPIPAPASPIILDLDGDGVETSSIDGGVHFDHAGDGFRDLTGWIGADDGFLVRDLNGNGLIDSGRELFGSEALLADGTRAPHGFAVLSQLDLDGNRRLTEADPAFSSLRVWRDANLNGRTDAGELLSLPEAGIRAINTGFTNSKLLDSNGNAHRQVGTYIDSNGVQQAATDVWFMASPGDTIAVENLPVSEEIAALPELEGYGTMHSLRQAMVRDPHLQVLVQKFVDASTWPEAVLAARDAIWRWTGADAHSADSRGPAMPDGRWLYMIEAFAGQGYLNNLGQPDPWAVGSGHITLVRAAGEIFSTFFARLQSQTHMRPLMDLVSVSWDDATKAPIVDYGLVVSHIVEIAVTDRPAAMRALSELITTLQGLSMLSPLARDQIRAGVSVLGDDAISLVVERSSSPSTDSPLAWVFSGNDVFHGGDGNDNFDGFEGDDLIISGGGDDVIVGGYGDDTLDGGHGDDTLIGAAGADTFRFGVGSGHDTVSSTTAAQDDVLELAGISSSDVRISRDLDKLVISLVNSGETLTVLDYFRVGGQSGWPLKEIRFDDGTTWDVDYISTVLGIPSFGADTLYGNELDDSINGGEGRDLLIGYAGADLLDGGEGSDTLDGGIGDDTLKGGGGADNFLYGHGNDWVHGQRSADAVVLAEGIKPTDVSVVRVATNLNNIELLIRTGTDSEGSVTLVNQGIEFTSAVSGIKELIFSDGTVWGNEEIRLRGMIGDGGNNAALSGYSTNDLIVGNGGRDNLSGERGSDTLLGGAGDDMIVGGDGADRIEGGRGNDELAGQNGADVYVFSRGDGQDVITPYAGAIGGLDAIEFSPDIAPHQVTLRRNGNDLWIQLVDTDDSIRVFNYFVAQFREVATIRFSNGVEWGGAQILSKVLLGTSENDSLNGDADVPNEISGGDGNDAIYGGATGGELDGGEGDDLLSASSAGSWSILGGAGNDYITGGSHSDQIAGGTGDDQIYANEGDDTLDGGSGDDWLEGRAGNDTYRFGRGSGKDTIENRSELYEGSFVDTLELGAGISESHVILTRAGDDLLLHIIHTDDVARLVNYFRPDDHAVYSVHSIVFNDGTSWDRDDVTSRLTEAQVSIDAVVNGTPENESLVGGSGHDTISAGAGDDTIDGGGGNDALDGGEGVDTYLFGRTSGKDTITRTGSGADLDRVLINTGIAPGDIQVSYSGEGLLSLSIVGTSARLSGLESVSQISFADGTVWTYDHIIALARTATNANDFIFGSASDDTLAGDLGEDRLDGMAGDDVIHGGRGADGLAGSDGQDSLFGGDGDDNLSGGDGGDILLGQLGNDRLDGGNGDDRLDGGSGSDTLHGNTGADVFVFGKATGKDVLSADYQDSIEIESGIGPSDVVVVRENDDLLISIVDSSASQRVEHFFGSEDGASYEGFLVRFSDGTQWNLTELKARALVAVDGVANSLTGFAGAETIIGGSEADTIEGRMGDDAINGGAGNDSLRGDDGNDTVFGGAHDDVLAGGEGDDHLDGQEGADTVYGEGGADLLEGGQGRDWLYGDDGHDVLRGGSGEDQLAGGAGADSLQGGTGIDMLIGGLGRDTLEGGAGDDVIDAQEGDDTIRFGIGDGSDWIRSTGFISDPGFDTLEFGSGINPWDVWGTATKKTWTGGFGYSLGLKIGTTGDAVFVDNFFPGDSSEDSRRLIQQVRFADGTVWDSTMLENLPTTTVRIGESNAETLVGGTSRDRLYGLDGDDVVDGGLGDDWLDGGSGADTMIGGGGDDTYTIDSTADVLVEIAGGGIDSVNSMADYELSDEFENLRLTGTALEGIGNGVNNRIYGNDRSNYIDGRAGVDTMAGGAGDDSYFVDDAQDVVTELEESGNDTVTSTVSHALLANVENLVLVGSLASEGTGNSSNNRITGNGFSNRLQGAAGIDTLLGLGGDDVYVVDEFDDVVVEVADGGTDTVETSISYSLAANVENMTLTGDLSWTLSVGNSLSNRIVGNAGSNTLDGAGGADLLIGGAGYDTYVVDDAGDVIIEDASSEMDYVNSTVSWVLGDNFEVLQLTGDQAINGAGNALNNELSGNSADNRLDGKGGHDVMRGGAGNDTFVVDSANDSVAENPGEGTDTIESSVSLVLGSNIENLVLVGMSSITGTGNSRDNALSGNGAANSLNGGAGNDKLDGGAGSDTLAGGTGNDTYVVGTGDTVVEAASAGTDTVQSSIAWTLGANVENLVLTGSSALNGTGNTLNNVLTGNSAANVLTGGAGNDTYVVAEGDTVVEAASQGTDTVQSSATWTLGSNVEHLTLTGAASINGTGNTLANALSGNTGNNVLAGLVGADTLDGGAGIDTLNGGAGADTYLFARGHGQDTVQDNDTTSGVKDKVQFAAGIAQADLTYNRIGNNLEALINGTSDKLVFQDWYLGNQYHVEEFRFSDGTVQTDTQVQGLVSAMAGFNAPTSGIASMASMRQGFQTTDLAVSSLM